MNGKKWLKIWFSITIIFLSIVGAINYIIDPLWTFSHSNKFNSIQNHFNERQQKTNYIYFNGLNNYDGVLLGSSRTSYINQNDFHNIHIYNYALNGMHPSDYEGYINFTKNVKGTALKYIIIGADFENSKKHEKKELKASSYYINNTTSLFYRYKMLFSSVGLKSILLNG